MQSIHQQLRALYGDSPLIERGTVHVVHAARAASGLLHALRVGTAQSPHSETDFFVLNLCRARADALLTSAENLRREPTLHHDLQGPWADVLADYRTQLGKPMPPLCAILTRSGDIPDAHPLWLDASAKLLLCPPDAAPTLRARFRGRAEVLASGALDAPSAIQALHARGHALISVEAGPSTARTLYPGRVDELLLTTWLNAPADAPLAGPLPDDRQLLAGLSLRGSSERHEQGNTFRFDRWSSG